MNKEKEMVKKDWYPLEETSGYGLDRADLIRKARQGGAARIAVWIEDCEAEVIAIEDFCDWVFMATSGWLYCPDDETASKSENHRPRKRGIKPQKGQKRGKK